MLNSGCCAAATASLPEAAVEAAAPPLLHLHFFASTSSVTANVHLATMDYAKIAITAVVIIVIIPVFKEILTENL